VRTRQRSLTTCVSDEPFEIGRRSCCSFVPAMGGTLLQGTKKRTGLGPHPWQGRSRESQRIPAAYVRRSEVTDGARLPAYGHVPPRNLLPSTFPGVPPSRGDIWETAKGPSPLPYRVAWVALLFRRLQRFGPALAIPASVNRHTLRVAQIPGRK